jgi:hypothetical protein
MIGYPDLQKKPVTPSPPHDAPQKKCPATLLKGLEKIRLPVGF